MPMVDHFATIRRTRRNSMSIRPIAKHRSVGRDTVRHLNILPPRGAQVRWWKPM